MLWFRYTIPVSVVSSDNIVHDRIQLSWYVAFSFLEIRSDMAHLFYMLSITNDKLISFLW